MRKNNGVRKTVVVLSAAVALLAGLFAFQHVHKNANKEAFQGTLLNQPRDVSAFNLQGIDGKAMDNASLKGQWTLVFFGFTSCGSICPTTMAELAKMYSLLSQKNEATMPHVVMISIDPERDDLQRLQAYVKAFNPNFYAARGDESDVKKMTQELGIVYEKAATNGNNPDNYDVQHSGTLVLFNPQGQVSAFFTMPHNAAALAADYQLMVD